MADRRPNGSPPLPIRKLTFRMSEDPWQAVKDRAAERGETLSSVAKFLLTEYATGRVTPDNPEGP